MSDSFYINKNKCELNQCKCNNGTGTKGEKCPINNTYKCDTCNEGFHKMGNNCIRNICYCDNGLKDFNCKINNTSTCKSCNDNYYLKDNKCLPCPNNSTCKNSKIIATCTPCMNSDNKVDKSKYKVNCSKNNEGQCLTKKCFCNKGFPADSKDCPFNNTNFCKSCYKDYYLNKKKQCVKCITNGICDGSETIKCINSISNKPMLKTSKGCITCPNNATCDGSDNFTCPNDMFKNTINNTCDICNYAICDGSSIIKGECKKNAFKNNITGNCEACPDNTYCNGTNIIKDCHVGYYNDNNVCKLKKCLCPGGNGATGIDCPINNQHKCLSCIDNNYMFLEKKKDNKIYILSTEPKIKDNNDIMLLKYPPTKLTSHSVNKNGFSSIVYGQQYGNGKYIIETAGDNDTWNWANNHAFINVLSGYSSMHTNEVYNNSSKYYKYYGGNSDPSGTGYLGTYLKITLPEKILLKKLSIRQRLDSPHAYITWNRRMPRKFRIFGSNNNKTWNQVYDYDKNIDLLTLDSNLDIFYNIDTSGNNYYKQILIVVNAIGNSINKQKEPLNFDNLRLYALHKQNQFVITKSINTIYKYIAFKYGGYLDDYLFNLIAHYNFNYNFYDNTGNYNDIINHNSTFTDINKIVNYAVELTTASYLELPYEINPYKIWNNNGITFSIWFRITSKTGSWSRILDISPHTNSVGVLILLAENTNTLSVQIAGTRFDTKLTTSVDSQFHNLIWSIDTNGDWNVWVDGINQNCTIKFPIPNHQSNNIRYINKSAFSPDGSFAGQIDDFRIYNKVLNKNEILKVYNIKNFKSITKYYIDFPINTKCDILIVGGGGAGGNSMGGGGGAGGVIYTINQNLHGKYEIGVGRGGIGLNLSNSTNGQGIIGIEQDGKDSYIKKQNSLTYIKLDMGGEQQDLRAYGGGGGGIYFNKLYVNGRNGGSGGGSSETNDNNWVVNNGGLPLQPNTLWDGFSYIPGGKVGRNNTITTNDYLGGGGGGAGLESSDYTNGNEGFQIDITGVKKYYAAGGGAGQYSVSYSKLRGLGGSGIGGNGRIYNGTNYLRESTSGLDGTGSGGGGGSYDQDPDNPAGFGGSGIVIIKYISEEYAYLNEPIITNHSKFSEYITTDNYVLNSNERT